MEVQEALPPAGVIGAEPLSLVLQHIPRKPAKRCLRAQAANLGFFDRLRPEENSSGLMLFFKKDGKAQLPVFFRFSFS